MKIFASDFVLETAQSSDPWKANFPSSADNRFNYNYLMRSVKNKSIGNAPGINKDVVIVGAGVAGITAARELVRSGYKVTLYEASNRICGRHYTEVIDPSLKTVIEYGAMRMPFFADPGSNNSLLDYFYANERSGIVAPFTNPGAAPGGTGIWVNGGYGPKSEKSTLPGLISWPKDGVIGNATIESVRQLATNYFEAVASYIGKAYVEPNWRFTWAAIINKYDRMSFKDLVFAEAIDPKSADFGKDGWFGGLAATQDQSDIFYTIGPGDGSWGAFYDLSALWLLRCTVFGFGTKLQSLISLPDFSSLPFSGDDTVKDSKGTVYAGPNYQGLQAISESLFYLPPPADLLGNNCSLSLYQMAQIPDSGFSFELNTAVTKLDFDDTQIVTESNGVKTYLDLGSKKVIVTPTLAAVERSLDIVPSKITESKQVEFDDTRQRAMNTQHMINSCKVFFKLTSKYWENDGSGMPQNIVSDGPTQDTYGVSMGPGPTDAVLLASYTWEDDAAKLLADVGSDEKLGDYILGKLDEITVKAGYGRISDHVESGPPKVIHWTAEPTYRGCSKLYRSHNERLGYTLLTYNNHSSKMPGLYLAGDCYSNEGGWTEPALRGAIDAVINIIKDSGGTFNGGFDYDQHYKPEIHNNIETLRKYPYQP
jgi:tryptophan 2-monooxygenase